MNLRWSVYSQFYSTVLLFKLILKGLYLLFKKTRPFFRSLQQRSTIILLKPDQSRLKCLKGKVFFQKFCKILKTESAKSQKKFESASASMLLIGIYFYDKNEKCTVLVINIIFFSFLSMLRRKALLFGVCTPSLPRPLPTSSEQWAVA
jgi:hypothetical protein